METITSWNPLGHSSCVMGLLYLYIRLLLTLRHMRIKSGRNSLLSEWNCELES